MDPVKKTVECEGVWEYVTKDGEKELVQTVKPTFQLNYDILVIAVGSKANTFGIPVKN